MSATANENGGPKGRRHIFESITHTTVSAGKRSERAAGKAARTDVQKYVEQANAASRSRSPLYGAYTEMFMMS
jgi:hypothetical protein